MYKVTLTMLYCIKSCSGLFSSTESLLTGSSFTFINKNVWFSPNPALILAMFPSVSLPDAL